MSSSTALSSEPYHVKIRPNREWIKLDWRSLWEYRDLLLLLVRRDLIAKYRQTVLGPAWAIIQPVLTTVVFSIVFGRVAKLPTEGVPPMLFYLCGLLGWNYFAQTFGATSATLVQNASLYGKVFFPRLIVPLSTLLSNVLATLIQIVTFLVFYLCYRLGPGGEFGMSWKVIFFPLLLVQIGVLSLGMGLLMSAVTAKYRDLMQITSVIVQLWMYATPVIYPISMVPLQFRWISLLNPMTAPVEISRYLFIGTSALPTPYLALSIGMTLVIFLAGLLMFQKVERSFIDTV